MPKQCDLCFKVLTNCVNQSAVSGKFPGLLQLSNISPVYKAPEKTIGQSLVTDIRHISKTYERLFFHQLS